MAYIDYKKKEKKTIISGFELVNNFPQKVEVHLEEDRQSGDREEI